MRFTMQANHRLSDRWRRSLLRRAAQRYADQGWRVLPGAVLVNDRYVCGPLCPTVACHPALDRWEVAASSDLSDVDDWWATDAFSVLLATGGPFDVIEVPARVGASAVRASVSGSDDEAGWPGPVAVSPAGRWMFFVAPGGSLRPELSAQHDMVMHGAGSWVPAPPTRTPAGQVRWEIHPGATDWRLPDPQAVQRVLVAQLPPLGRVATFATTTARLGRAAA